MIGAHRPRRMQRYNDGLRVSLQPHGQVQVSGSIMNYVHLPSNSRSAATAWNFPLGIEGFRYADLNRVRRLMALDQVFHSDLRAADPALADRYEQSCREHACGQGKLDSRLLIDVARHLDRFI